MANLKVLDPVSAGNTIEELAILQASLDALCIKTRGFTTNLLSESFYEYHSFFNLTIEFLQKASYDTAERIRSVRGWANHSVEMIEQKSIIRDPAGRVTDVQMMFVELTDDYTKLSLLTREIFAMSGPLADAGTIALTTQMTLRLEHFLWEIRVMAGEKQ